MKDEKLKIEVDAHDLWDAIVLEINRHREEVGLSCGTLPEFEVQRIAGCIVARLQGRPYPSS